MKKKLLAILLVAVMLVSCLAACGQNGEAQQATENKGSEVSNVTEPPAKEKEEVVTVTWCFRNDPQEDDEQVLAAVNEILREKYNLELNLIAIPNAEYNDKMNLKITSGEEWDICYTANFTNNFHTNVEREAFLALNDLLENSEVGKNLVSVLPEGLTDVATVNGNIYAIPNYQLIYNHRGVYVQKDLADEFGLDVDAIDDITDMEPFFEWVRDNKEDIWPICESLVYLDLCYGKEGTVIRELGVAFGDDTYTVEHGLATEADYENLKLLNSYFKRGFYRSDTATVVDNSSDLVAGRYAAIPGVIKPGGESDYTSKYGEEYIGIGFGEPFLPYDAGASTMLGINVNSENAEAALKMIYVMWTDKEVFNTFLFGIEGEHYNKVGENRVELIPDSGYNRSGMGWACGNQFNAWLLPSQADDVWEVTEANNKSAVKSGLTGFVPNYEAVTTERAQCASVDSEFSKGFRYVEDFDAWYNEYVEKLKLAGIDTINAEIQRQINEWRVANGK